MTDTNPQHGSLTPTGLAPVGPEPQLRDLVRVRFVQPLSLQASIFTNTYLDCSSNR